MPTTVTSQANVYRDRLSFAKLPEVMDIPNLISIQVDSFNNLMTEGSIVKSLLLFALPLIFGNLLQQLYNTADSIIVGNFVGANALAAVGSSGSHIYLLIGSARAWPWARAWWCRSSWGPRTTGKPRRPCTPRWPSP